MANVTPRAACRRASFACAVLLATGAQAESGWFEAGDRLLRSDLTLLSDAQVIRLPVSQWPMPKAAVRYALDNAREHFAGNAAVTAALARVRSRLDASAGRRPAKLELGVTAGEPALLRQFATLGRESGELVAGAEFRPHDRAEVSLRISAAADAQDDRALRFDGSHATVRMGNWLLSAQTLDRWWGPGHEGSLILSSNARPMPAVVVERAEARPFATPWLDWLGPWRFTFGIGRMEGERADIDSPLFMTWRVAVMPFDDIELGFSRTAQFCGEQLTCDLESFGNMLAGNDNVGVDASPENEPGNQMAGFDLRWRSPLFEWPYAITFQAIGEDESSYLPAKYLVQFGLEVWKPLASGDYLQAFAEYADTSCSAISGSGPYYNCAYNQGQFDVEGYRYRGRVLGHTTDADSRSAALGVILSKTRGDLWSATLRAADLNRDATPDPRNTVSAAPAEYAAVELGWRGERWGQQLAVEVGLESLERQDGERDVQPFGFLSWRHQFSP
jgi:hypothetical protein